MTAEEQAIVDREHLKLLTLFHYVSGGFTLAMGLLFGLWLAFMSAMLAMIGEQAEEMPEFFPGVLLAVFGVFLAMFIALGVLEILSGWFISKRRNRLFAIIVAIPNLLFIPYGTLLSLFTILVLERPSVKETFR